MSESAQPTIKEIITRLERALKNGEIESSKYRPFVTALRNYYIHSSRDSWENAIYSEDDFNARLPELKIWAESQSFGRNTPNVYKSRARRAIAAYKKLTQETGHERPAIATKQITNEVIYYNYINLYYEQLKEILSKENRDSLIGVIPCETKGKGMCMIIYSQDTITDDLKTIQKMLQSILEVSRGKE